MYRRRIYNVKESAGRIYFWCPGDYNCLAGGRSAVERLRLGKTPGKVSLDTTAYVRRRTTNLLYHVIRLPNSSTFQTNFNYVTENFCFFVLFMRHLCTKNAVLQKHFTLLYRTGWGKHHFAFISTAYKNCCFIRLKNIYKN